MYRALRWDDKCQRQLRPKACAPGTQKGSHFQRCSDSAGHIYAPTRALALGLIDEVKTIDNLRDKFGNDLSEIGPEPTGMPFRLKGCSRGEDLFDLAMQKVRDAIQAS